MTQSKSSVKDKTANSRQKNRRDRMQIAGFVRRDVWAHHEDWDQIRKLEKRLQKRRGIEDS